MTPIYTPNFVPSPETIFSELKDLAWLSVTEARREYFMSETPRSYSYGKGIGERQYHSSPFSENVLALMKSLGDHYNVCFLNRYDNQKHQLGWHADDSPSMDQSHPIAVISFGAEREIWWRLQGETGVTPPEQRQLLGHGSLFVMPAGFQEKFFHRIPRCDRECGTRISLTFRRYSL